MSGVTEAIRSTATGVAHLRMHTGILLSQNAVAACLCGNGRSDSVSIEHGADVASFRWIASWALSSQARVTFFVLDLRRRDDRGR